MFMVKYAAWLPSWVQTLDAGIAANAHIRGICMVCHRYRDVDLVKLREIKGGSYSLINRRTRCKLKPDCPGWVRFFYLHGVMRGLWDDETNLRWGRQMSWMRQRLEGAR